MRHLTLIGAALAALALPAAAQEQMEGYGALLNVQDFYNSNGERLGDFCAILQQDRANYHRFGNYDDMDGYDPYFTTPEARSILSADCRIVPGFEYIEDAVMSGRPYYVYVIPVGSNGKVRWVEVVEGAG